MVAGNVIAEAAGYREGFLKIAYKKHNPKGEIINMSILNLKT